MSYKGLCVGGDLAGQWASHNLRKFYVGLHPGRNALGNGSFVIVDVPIDYDPESLGTPYVYVSAEDVCEFWVPMGKDLKWAMQELFRCYRRNELGQSNETGLD